MALSTVAFKQPGPGVSTPTGFHWHAKHFELNFFLQKLSSRWSNQLDKIILTASQYAWILAINEIHDILKRHILTLVLTQYSVFIRHFS